MNRIADYINIQKGEKSWVEQEGRSLQQGRTLFSVRVPADGAEAVVLAADSSVAGQ